MINFSMHSWKTGGGFQYLQCVNNFVQQVSHTQIAFEHCYLVKSCCDVSYKKKSAYQHMFDFDRGQIAAYWDCSLFYQSIAAPVNRDPMTACKIWNRWFRRVTQNVIMDLSSLQSLTVEKTDISSAWL